MYVLIERLLSFNWQRFTLHKNEKRNLELYRKIPSSTSLLNSPRKSFTKQPATQNFPGSLSENQQQSANQ